MQPRSHSVTSLKRLCFSVKKSKGRKQKVLELLPNYPIRKGRISVDSALPSLDTLTNQKTPNTSFAVNEQIAKQIENLREKFEMVYPSVGQLVTLFVLKPSLQHRGKGADINLYFPNPLVSTCSLVTINDKFESLFVLGCLHGFMLVLPKDNPYTTQDYLHYCFFVKNDIDLAETIWKAHELFKYKLSRKDVKDACWNIVPGLFMDIINSRFQQERPFVTQLEVCQDWLERRKKFIAEKSVVAPVPNSKGRAEHPLLDPEFDLQPLPSLDLCTFKFSQNSIVDYIAFIKSKGAESNFEINENSMSFKSSMSALRESDNYRNGAGQRSVLGSRSSDKKPMTFFTIELSKLRKLQENQLVSILGFQNVKVEEPEPDIYRKSFKKNMEGYLDAEFMNENLSLGFCQVKTYSDYLFTFKGNTTEGSSGSPILDDGLQIVGINFGCYYDYQSEQTVKNNIKNKGKKGKEGRANSLKRSEVDRGKSKGKRQFSVDRKSGKEETPNALTLAAFEIEINEPGQLAHESSLKNRNLAVATTHPVFVSWLSSIEKNIEETTKNQPISFPDPKSKNKKLIKDKIGNKYENGRTMHTTKRDSNKQQNPCKAPSRPQNPHKPKY